MPGSWAVPEPSSLTPSQQPLPPSQRRRGAHGASLRPLLTQPGAFSGPGRAAPGLGGIAGEAAPLQTGAEPCVYKAWGSSPAGLFSTTTPRLSWQHGEARPERRRLNPQVPRRGSDLPMGPRLLLVLALLQTGECHPGPSALLCLLLPRDSLSLCHRLCVLRAETSVWCSQVRGKSVTRQSSALQWETV